MPLSKAQMRMYATAVGFSHPDLIAEIGSAESGGDSNAVNPIGATGWLQVLQPVHVKDHPTWTVAYLKNPLANARAAKVLWDADKRAGGDGTRPWVDSMNKGNGGGWGKSAAYARFKESGGNGAVDAAWTPFEDGPLDWYPDKLSEDAPLSDQVNGLLDMAKLSVKFGQWASNPRSWLSVGYVLIGGVVVVVALSATVRGAVVGQVTGLGSKVLKK